jgi:carboxymethylenebutenolidase
MGFCAGGTWSFRFAAAVPELNAAVVFYGNAPEEAALAGIKTPVLGLFGADDQRVNDTIPVAEVALKRAGAPFETHIYPGATHAFLEYQAEGRNAAATADAWPRATAFLGAHLK